MVAMLLVLGFIVSAQAVTVSSESDFKELYLSGGVQDIELARDLSFYDDRLGESRNDLNMTVDLGTYTLWFLDNYSEYYDGGAIWNGGGINYTSGSVNFTGNGTGKTGGAIYNTGTINYTSGSVDFTSNGASYYGGAIYNNDTGTINFTGESVTFSGNSAEDSGGAIYNRKGTINFTSSSVTFKVYCSAKRYR